MLLLGQGGDVGVYDGELGGWEGAEEGHALGEIVERSDGVVDAGSGEVLLVFGVCVEGQEVASLLLVSGVGGGVGSASGLVCGVGI